MHVIPFLLCGLTLFSLTICGYGTVDGLLGKRYSATCRWLLMPIAGLSIYVLAAAVLNRAGLPARTFATPLFLLLLIANIVYGFKRRPRFASGGAALWGCGVLASALLVGWPLLVAGTNWISMGNPDITQYILGANHLFEHGFYQVPQIPELNREVDRSWDFSFWYSIGEVRSSSQLMLACFMGLTGLTAAEAFMTLMVALHVILLLTASSLVCKAESKTAVALVAFVAIAVSAQSALGMYLQLLSQDYGLALLAACAFTLLDVPPNGVKLLSRSAVCSLFVAALFLGYPELSPFLVVSFVLFTAVALFKRAVPWLDTAKFVGLVCTLAVILGNVSLPGSLHMLFADEGYFTNNTAVNLLFPDYMTPLGFGIGWGLVPYGGGDVASVEVQLLTLTGMIFYVIAFAMAWMMAWRLEAAGFMAGAMLLSLPYLYATNNGFGMFKVAMYCQPFVLAMVAIVVGMLVPSAATAIQRRRAA